MNGDGSISFREYAIAKRFDLDGDNILNAQEKAECMAQLKNGFEDNLYWDPINSNNGTRVVQKGGKIFTDSGEFGKEKDIVNKGDTLTALKERRKSKLKLRIFQSNLDE